MARNAPKKQSSSTNKSTHSQVTAAPLVSSNVPEPFVPAPAQLRPLFSTLPTDHIYAIHVDRNTIELKKRVYMVPVLLNIVITLLLCIRVYFAAPLYLDQIITIFGHDTAWKVEPAKMGFADLITTIMNRTGLLMVDYAIFGFIGSWPWEFLFGSKYSRHTGALGWRRKVGFQNVEIVVRKGRKWDTPLLKEANKVWTREDELAIKVKLDPAMRKSYTQKTGYLLLDKDWDLDFKGMIDAHRLVEKGRLDLKDLDHIVLVHYQKQWLLWRVYEEAQPGRIGIQADRTINNFREKLVSLNCEEVFFRWIELIQYESSTQGGLTESKKAKALEDLKHMLAAHKVDDAKFIADIGGVKALPGMTQMG